MLHTAFNAALPSQIGMDYSTCTRFLLNKPVKKEYELEIGKARPSDPVDTPRAVRATGTAQGLEIDNGLLKVVLAAPGNGGIFASCESTYGLRADADGIVGPAITDDDDLAYAAETESYDIIENGPARVFVRLRGVHRGAAGTLMDFEMNVYLYAGVSWMSCDYRLLNYEGRDVQLKSIYTRVLPRTQSGPPVDTTRGGKAHGPYGKTVSFLGEDAEHVRVDVDQPYAKGYHAQGSVFSFFGNAYAGVSNRTSGGIMGTVLQPLQNYPKAFDADQHGLTIHLKPEDAPRLNVREGMAFMQSYMLWFHPPETTTEELVIRSAMYSTPERPFIEPWAYDETDAFAERLDFRPGNSDVEDYLYTAFQESGYGMGMMHWFDYAWTTAGPEGGEAGIVWADSYYDYPTMAYRTALRVCSAEAYEAFLASGRHLLNVDISHRLEDPEDRNTGGMHCSTAYHTMGQVDQAWMWVNAALDYYHATGDPFALEKAIGLGECEERILDRNHWDGGSPRQSGTPIRIFSMLYYETHETKWLELADRMVATNAPRLEEWGTIDEPTVDAVTTGRKTFMMGVLSMGYYYYYRCTGREAGKDQVIGIARDAANANLTHAGLFVYIDGSAGSRGGAAGLSLYPAAAAYELTGDPDHLRAVLPAVKRSLRQGPTPTQPPIVFDNGNYVHGRGTQFAHHGPAIVKLYAGMYDAGLMDSDLDFIWHLEGSGYAHGSLKAGDDDDDN